MNGAGVFLVSFITSALAATGSVYVSKKFQDPEPIFVPSVRSLSEEDARRVLQARDLVALLGPKQITSKQEAGTVVAQVPPAGQEVAPSSAVTLTLAEAPPSVPSVVGQSVSEATAAVEKAGFQVQLAEPRAHETVEEGKVATQLPPAGETHDKGGKVVLTPSAGPAKVELPKITGMNLQAAKQALEKAGFKLVEVKWVYADDLYPHTVLRQKPEAGEEVSPDTSIEVTVNRR